MKREWLLLGLIVLLGGFLRFYALGRNPPGYFSDEVDIAYQVKSLLSTGRDYEGNFLPLQIHSFSDTRTSIPIYLTLLVTLIPGMDGLLAVRIVPAFFGVLGLVFTFLLLNRVFVKQSPAVGLAGAFLLALTPWHLHYSRVGFEASVLYCFLVAGLYFFDLYQKKARAVYGIFSWVFLALMPMVYSTAKLSIFFIPLVLWWWPNMKTGFFKSRKDLVFVAALFIPMAALLLNGGAAKRFYDIAVFTDPTVPSQVNYERQLALGPNARPGSVPSLFDVAANNKVSYWLGAIIGNIFKGLSPDFLFVTGDSFPRHSLPGLGVMDKSLALLIAVGLGVLLANYKKYGRVLIISLPLIFLAVLPSALTRDGATHATRLFLLLLPLTTFGAFGLYAVFSFRRVLGLVVVLVIFYETFVYEYAYNTRYPLESEKYWHAGIGEAVTLAGRYPERAVVISPSYENPLIFYLYYGHVPPAFFQGLFRRGNFLEPVNDSLNLSGNRFDGENVYFAGLENKNDDNPLRLHRAIYFLTDKEVSASLRKQAQSEVKLPSGEPAYWVFLTN